MAFRDDEVSALRNERVRLERVVREQEEQLAEFERARDRRGRVASGSWRSRVTRALRWGFPLGLLGAITLASWQLVEWAARPARPALGEAAWRTQLPLHGVVMAADAPADGATCAIDHAFLGFISVRCGSHRHYVSARDVACMHTNAVVSCNGTHVEMRRDEISGVGSLVVMTGDREGISIALGGSRVDLGLPLCCSMVDDALVALPANLGSVRELALGRSTDCAISDRGELGGWGSDRYVQLSVPSAAASDVLGPQHGGPDGSAALARR